MTSEAPRRLTVIADLHMSAGRLDDFHEDGALALFLDALRERSSADRAISSLLLLGDTLDFARIELEGGRARRLDPSSGAALLKLELAARRHGAVFEALGRLAAAGVRIDLVPGNHDLELAHPAVRERLLALLRAAAGDAAGSVELRFHPWIFHIPGLVYAEHGHQHHDLNRTPGLLRMGRAAAPPIPFGNRLGEWLLEVRDARGGRGSLVRAPAATMRMLARAPRAARSAAGVEDLQDLDACSESTALPAGALAAVDAAAAAPPAALARRLLAKAARRARATATPADLYMREAASAVQAVLTARGASVPFHLFAHTHVPADIPLAAGGRYLNPGTWSSLRPRGQRETSLTFVELDHQPGEAPGARLMAWDAAAARGQELADAPPAEPVPA